MASVSEVAAGVLGGGAIASFLTALVTTRGKHRESLDAEFASIRRELAAENKLLEMKIEAQRIDFQAKLDAVQAELAAEKQSRREEGLEFLNLIRYRRDDPAAWREMEVKLEERHGDVHRRRRTDDRKHILIADDNPDSRDLLYKTFTLAGYSVEQASTGAMAVRLYDAAVAAGAHFDLVMLDYEMPDRNGAEAARVIRNERRDSKTPVVIYTAHGGDQGVEDDLGGIDVYLWPKPILPAEMCERAEKLIAGRC